jgi:hypothetical protein
LASSGSQPDVGVWWWVVECSDYIRKQYPGTPRYTVIAASRLNEYRNILCKVRYSSESDANAAAFAAESGAELNAWQIVRWPPSHTSTHQTSRYEAFPESDIRNVWKLGAKTVQSGLSHPDAVKEASRRCALPDRWCVIQNDEETKGQEAYTVSLFDFLSFSQKDNVLLSCESEQEAWQEIPRIKAEAEQRLAQLRLEEMERRKTERRWDRISSVFRVGVLIAGAVVLIWLCITVVRWFWQHPLFR